MESQILVFEKEYSPDRTQVKLLWFDISRLSTTKQFFLCCFAVFVFYLVYGYLQELIFTLDGFKPYGWYLTLVQFACYSVFGWTERKLQCPYERTIPMKTYLLLALLTLGTMGFSNSSGKRYGVIDFVAAACMCLGLSLFTLADSMVSPNFNLLGVFMISCALICDAAIGNVQEKSMKAHKATNTEVVLYSYAIGFVYLFVVMLITGDLQRGISFCSKHPWETYGYGLLFSISGYFGLQVVLTLVRTCGAFTAATVTTCRKAVSIIISFMFFQKPFTFQYVWSGLLVILGIYLNIYSKNRDKIEIKMYFNFIKNVLLKPCKQIRFARQKESKRLLSDV